MSTGNKYNIASGTVFYNDCKSLERTLESLHDKMDLMFCIDGKFKHFKDDNIGALSNDGGRELVQSYDNAVLVDIPNSYEVQKRTAYLDMCEKYRPNYLLIVDSDEYVYEYDDALFKQSLKGTCETSYYDKYNVFSVMVEINQPNYDHIVDQITGKDKPQIVSGVEKQFAHHPRLWRRPWEMMYNVKHYNFINKNPETGALHYCETNASVAIIPGLKLGHDHLLRTKDFLSRRLPYQKQLVHMEQKKLRIFMQKHNKKPTFEEYDAIVNSPEYDTE